MRLVRKNIKPYKDIPFRPRFRTRLSTPNESSRAMCSVNAVDCVATARVLRGVERDRRGYYYGDNDDGGGDDDETDAHDRLTGHWRPRAPRERRSIKFALSVLVVTPSRTTTPCTVFLNFARRPTTTSAAHPLDHLLYHR
jgi:hypothetical protein